MLNVYLNHPASNVTVHGDAGCRAIRKMGKPAQRQVRIDAASRVSELSKFDVVHRFAASTECNDMWVVLDFGDPVEETRVLAEIKSALGRRYKPFRDARVKTHC